MTQRRGKLSWIETIGIQCIGNFLSLEALISGSAGSPLFSDKNADSISTFSKVTQLGWRGGKERGGSKMISVNLQPVTIKEEW